MLTYLKINLKIMYHF